ncbi:glycoside hydrolase family 31 protein [Mucilaginibacter sp. UR6-1]|uniref:glycoside hydrolase family 31 protein n=1 Tax=Mucilaginibacter sp. UR6-1 TaxID=1435643 RepID=UPI001E3DA6D6|nr:glycoside hydrolase family 31 protein [Mucilaginibacter sp. UR6-1]MCC8410375.1 glycoside hydrolase family 31 protein [Mucilaginibacter sp. UR6-1]
MQTQLLGNAKQVTTQNDHIIIQTAEATAKIWVYAPAIIRVNITQTPDKPDASFAVIQQPETGIKFTEADNELTITTGQLILKVNKTPLRFSFYTAEGKVLSEDDARFGVNWQNERVVNYRKLYADEKFIGLGEKTGDLNRRGTHYVNWNTDASKHTIYTDPLYKTFPFFIGLHSGLTYGLFFDNTHKSYFDFGATTDDEMSWFGADGGDMNYYFFGAQGVADIIKDYTWLTGRMEMPPLWSIGYQQCRYSYMSADEVLSIAQKFREHNIPADVIYCDIDYMDNYKIFTWNDEAFPDPKGMIDKLKALDFRTVCIVDPGIKVEEGYKQYDEGVAKNYFATYTNGDNYIASVWPGRCHFPNFFDDEVKEWWGAAFTALTEPGVEGFWNDMNEPAAWGQNIPYLVKFGDRYMAEVRNAYGMEMTKATYNGTRQILGNKRPFMLTRAAYCGTQRFSAVWTGDNTATDEHMLYGQRLVNSLGLVGMSFTGVDIGGYTGNPTPELMLRWNSLGVYIPMYRNHAEIGTAMREPWEWGQENMAIIRKDIELRYRLLPYIYSGFYESSQNGLPLSRTLAIDYTPDENVFDVRYQNQFLFGNSLLVAPVESTKLTAEVYLPEGEWYRFGNDKAYEGGMAHTVPAPLNDLPVFVKGGGIIPMQSVIQSTNEAGDGILYLHIWKGIQDSTFIYYEDDGVTYDNERGIFHKREISYHAESNTVMLAVAEGSYTSKFNTLKLISHGFDKSIKEKEALYHSGVIEISL